MAQSVKLSDEIMAFIRKEADLQSRSVAGQITHWVNIGRACGLSDKIVHKGVPLGNKSGAAARPLDQLAVAHLPNQTDQAYLKCMVNLCLIPPRP